MKHLRIECESWRAQTNFKILLKAIVSRFVRSSYASWLERFSAPERRGPDSAASSRRPRAPRPPRPPTARPSPHGAEGCSSRFCFHCRLLATFGHKATLKTWCCMYLTLALSSASLFFVLSLLFFSKHVAHFRRVWPYRHRSLQRNIRS